MRFSAKLMVTPGFSSLLTPLASSALFRFSSMALFMASRTSATTSSEDIGPSSGGGGFGTAWGILLGGGALRTVFRGGLGFPFSAMGRPVDWVAAPNGGPVGLSISMSFFWTYCLWKLSLRVGAVTVSTLLREKKRNSDGWVGELNFADREFQDGRCSRSGLHTKEESMLM